MDIRQLEETIALALANSRFMDAPGDAILTAVQITRQDIGVFLASWRTVNAFTLPFAIFRVVGAAPDKDAASHPSGTMGRGVRQFAKASIWVAAGSIADPVPSPPPFVAVGNVANDNAFGQGAMIGTAVAIGTRANQGVDRIVPELIRQAFGNGVLVDYVHGFQGRVSGTGDVAAPFPQINVRRIDIEIMNASAQESYHSPFRLHVSGKVGTTVTLAWSPVPTRADFLAYVLKRNGNPIYTGTAASFVDAVGAAGPVTYTLVATYDDAARPPTTGNRTSGVVTLAYTV